MEETDYSRFHIPPPPSSPSLPGSDAEFHICSESPELFGLEQSRSSLSTNTDREVISLLDSPSFTTTSTFSHYFAQGNNAPILTRHPRGPNTSLSSLHPGDHDPADLSADQRWHEIVLRTWGPCWGEACSNHHGRNESTSLMTLAREASVSARSIGSTVQARKKPVSYAPSITRQGKPSTSQHCRRCRQYLSRSLSRHSQHFSLQDFRYKHFMQSRSLSRTRSRLPRTIFHIPGISLLYRLTRAAARPVGALFPHDRGRQEISPVSTPRFALDVERDRNNGRSLLHICLQPGNARTLGLFRQAVVAVELAGRVIEDAAAKSSGVEAQNASAVSFSSVIKLGRKERNTVVKYLLVSWDMVERAAKIREGGNDEEIFALAGTLTSPLEFPFRSDESQGLVSKECDITFGRWAVDRVISLLRYHLLEWMMCMLRGQIEGLVKEGLRVRLLGERFGDGKATSMWIHLEKHVFRCGMVKF